MKKQLMVPGASILKKSILLVLTVVVAVSCSSSSDEPNDSGVASTLNEALESYDVVTPEGSDDMANLDNSLTGYDDVAPHVHDDMGNLSHALMGFSDEYGCIAPQEYHAEMDHCMDMGHDAMSEVAEGEMLVMDHSEHGTTDEMPAMPVTGEMPVMGDTQDCAEGWRWYEKGTYPGMPEMISMCMPDVG